MTKEFDDYVKEKIRQSGGRPNFDLFLQYVILRIEDTGVEPVEVPYSDGKSVDGFHLFASFYPKFEEEFRKYLVNFQKRYRVDTDFDDEMENFIKIVLDHQKALKTFDDYNKKVVDYSMKFIRQPLRKIYMGFAVKRVSLNLKKDGYRLIKFFGDAEKDMYMPQDRLLMFYGPDIYKERIDLAIVELEEDNSAKFVDQETYVEFFKRLKVAAESIPEILDVK